MCKNSKKEKTVEIRLGYKTVLSTPFPFHYIISLPLKPGPPIVAAITAMLDHNSLRYWNWYLSLMNFNMGLGGLES